MNVGSTQDDPTHPVYNALSYCWGDSSTCNDIILKGARKSATVSLESALKYLRKDDNEFHIWADAICINQNGKEKKGDQVQMMDRLYKEANLVIIWLVIARDYSDLVIDACEGLGSRTLGGKNQSREDDVEMEKDRVRCTLSVTNIPSSRELILPLVSPDTDPEDVSGSEDYFREQYNDNRMCDEADHNLDT